MRGRKSLFNVRLFDRSMALTCPELLSKHKRLSAQTALPTKWPSSEERLKRSLCQWKKSMWSFQNGWVSLSSLHISFVICSDSVCFYFYRFQARLAVRHGFTSAFLSSSRLLPVLRVNVGQCSVRQGQVVGSRRSHVPRQGNHVHLCYRRQVRAVHTYSIVEELRDHPSC